MFKHIVHIIFFVAGAGVGVWWGVNHPTEAAALSENETAKVQSTVALAKKKLLEDVIAEENNGTPTTATAQATPSHLSKFQDMLKKVTEEVKNAGTNQLTPMQNNN